MHSDDPIDLDDKCHVCGPIKHECPTVVCLPCAVFEIPIRPTATGLRIVSNRPPRGWTIRSDRAEEAADLSILRLLRVTG